MIVHSVALLYLYYSKTVKAFKGTHLILKCQVTIIWNIFFQCSYVVREGD